MNANWWFIKKFGFLTWLAYEGERRRRERKSGETFDPLKHGEPLLRSIGATEEQIKHAKEVGLA